MALSRGMVACFSWHKESLSDWWAGENLQLCRGSMESVEPSMARRKWYRFKMWSRVLRTGNFQIWHFVIPQCYTIADCSFNVGGCGQKLLCFRFSWYIYLHSHQTTVLSQTGNRCGVISESIINIGLERLNNSQESRNYEEPIISGLYEFQMTHMV